MMRRTTIAIDPPLFEEIRELAEKEDKPLTKVIGDLLAVGLRERKSQKQKKVPRLKWHSQRMGSRIDYSDKDEVFRILDQVK